MRFSAPLFLNVRLRLGDVALSRGGVYYCKRRLAFGTTSRPVILSKTLAPAILAESLALLYRANSWMTVSISEGTTMRTTLLALSALVLASSAAKAEEIHLMCDNNRNAPIRLDIDATRLTATVRGNNGTQEYRNGRVQSQSGESGDLGTKSVCTDTVAVDENKILFGVECKSADTSWFATIDRYTGAYKAESQGGGNVGYYRDHCSPVASRPLF